MITKEKTSTVIVVNTAPEHVAAIAGMQRLIYPTLTDDELYTEAKYYNHLELFPEGQFTVLAEEHGEWVPVASTSTFRSDFDFDDIQHTYLEAVASGWFSNHNPDGDWLYGGDMAVHPNYRGKRVGRRLYEARQQLVYDLNLRGEIAGGMLPGYHYHRTKLSVPQYILRVSQGHLFDPTLSMQLKNGFRIRGILHNHITDPRCDNKATLLVRENPYYYPTNED